MPSDDCLKKLYIEPTARCNLRCKMCFRNSWKNEIIGDMRPETFRKAMTTMPDSVETVFFGGMGEPLAHPDIVEMVRTASSLGKRVELLSNGTLLDARRTAELLDAGLDMLWLSIDALDDGRYAQIRRNSQLALVKEHIVEFNRQRARLDRTVRLGVAFVVMKSNAHELALLPYFSTYYKVNEVNISNVIPTDEHTASEVLYNNVVDWGLGDPAPMESSPRIHLPLMDWQDPAAQEGLRSLLSTSMCSVYLSGQRVSRAARHCRFIDEGMAFVKFDGHVSPCMSLLRNTTLYWRQKQRETRSHFFGDLAEQGLDEIWNAPDYADFRRRVRNFEFSPCYRCSLCENWEQGLTDCYGNDAPTCGGCLWSEGRHQLPVGRYPVAGAGRGLSAPPAPARGLPCSAPARSMGPCRNPILLPSPSRPVSTCTGTAKARSSMWARRASCAAACSPISAPKACPPRQKPCWPTRRASNF